MKVCPSCKRQQEDTVISCDCGASLSQVVTEEQRRQNFANLFGSDNPVSQESIEGNINDWADILVWVSIAGGIILLAAPFIAKHMLDSPSVFMDNLPQAVFLRLMADNWYLFAGAAVYTAFSGYLLSLAFRWGAETIKLLRSIAGSRK